MPLRLGRRRANARAFVGAAEALDAASLGRLPPPLRAALVLGRGGALSLARPGDLGPAPGGRPATVGRGEGPMEVDGDGGCGGGEGTGAAAAADGGGEDAGGR